MISPSTRRLAGQQITMAVFVPRTANYTSLGLISIRELHTALRTFESVLSDTWNSRKRRCLEREP